jgi:hypothetical protein
VRFAQRAFALQVPRHFQGGFDFLFGEIQITDQMAAA